MSVEAQGKPAAAPKINSTAVAIIVGALIIVAGIFGKSEYDKAYPGGHAQMVLDKCLEESTDYLIGRWSETGRRACRVWWNMRSAGYGR